MTTPAMESMPPESMRAEPTGPAEDPLAALARLDELDVADHPQVYESIHRALREQLASRPDQ